MSQVVFDNKIRRRGAYLIKTQLNSLNPLEVGIIADGNAVPAPSDVQFHQPIFTGNASEFFRIWVVNMLLSLITLGIWSAWATVRNRRYLYGNTEFAGNRFDFHGNPWAILRGRVLAVALFSAYAFGGDFYVEIPAAAVIIIICLFPWMLVSAVRFRLSNTSWRNLRFGFSATTKMAYARLGLPVLLILTTFVTVFLLKQRYDISHSYTESMQFNGLAFLVLLPVSFLLVPLAIHRIKSLTFNHALYGQHAFGTDIRLIRFAGFYGKVLLVFFTAFLVIVLFFFLISALSGGVVAMLGKMGSGSGKVSMAFFYIVTVMTYLMPVAVWNVKTSNYIVSTTRFENLQLKMDMKVWAYWWIMVTNAFVAVVSLGLAIPWTKIRMITYKLNCLSVRGKLGVYKGNNLGTQTAIGDEIGEAFDIDFGF